MPLGRKGKGTEGACQGEHGTCQVLHLCCLVHKCGRDFQVDFMMRNIITKEMHVNLDAIYV